MYKLIEFLQKEVPNSANNLNDSINTTLEIIGRTRTAVMGRINTLAQNGKHKDAIEFFEADEKLMNIEHYLKELISIDSLEIQDEVKSDATETIDNRPNYDSYKVDETEPHNLGEDFTNKRPVCFSLEGKKYSVRSWNRLLIMVCEILSQKNPELFQTFPDDESMQGRTRTYFSHHQMKYACKKVSGTDIYVLTNNNGNGNCNIVIKLLEKYDIPITSMKIFLRADYSLLHDDDQNENVKKN